MKRIVILYEHVVREYESCLTLRALLEQGGYSKVDVLSFQYELWTLWRLSRRTKIDCVVVPYVYSEKSLLPIKFLFKSKNPPLIINLHHEQIAACFDEHKLLPRDWIAKCGVVHFTWGESFKQRLLSLNIPENIIFETGNIRTLRSTKNKSRYELARQYGLDANKTWVMICESGYIIHPESEINHRVENRKYLREDLEDRNKYLRATVIQIEQQINNLNESFFDTFEVIYRAHPGRENHLNVGPNVKSIDSEDIYTWFPHLSCVLSRVSTLLHEADRHNVLPVRYDPVDIPKRLLPRGLENYQYIKNFEDIRSVIINSDQWPSGETSKKYLGNSKSTDTMIATFRKILSDPAFDRNLKSIKFNSRHFIWPRLVCNLLAPYVAKYNLSWNCRFCKSLSNIFKDGPPQWLYTMTKK